MIVLEKADRWEILFQRNHALVAGALGIELAPEFRPERWIEMITAIIGHDDAQSGFTEESYINKDGVPLNFRDFGENLLQAEQVVKESQYRSKFVTLMISMHACGLRAPKKKKSLQLKEFLSRQKLHQGQLRAHLHISIAEAQIAYQVLRWCDECSLIICEDRLTCSRIPIQFGNLPGIKSQEIYRDQGSRLVRMEPWCFQRDSFEIKAEYYTIHPKIPFTSSAALGENLLTSMPSTRSWIFHK